MMIAEIKNYFRRSKYIKIILKLYRPYFCYKWRQRKIKTSGNENSDKVFFVIRRASRYTGIFSNYLVFLGWINYAEQKGWIPVIDMMTLPNVYLYPDQVGKVNSWEFFFKQPLCEGRRYSIEEVYKSKNVILSNAVKIPYMPADNIKFLEDYNKINFWNNLHNKYLEFSDDTNQFINLQCNNLFNKRAKFLGVHCRGTGYRLLTSTKKNAVGNPMQPSIDKMIEEANKLKNIYECDGLFLATEDIDYFNAFNKFFGNDLFTVDTEYIDANSIDLTKNTDTDYTTNRLDDKRLRGLEYIAAMIAYGKCHYSVSGINSGTIAVSIINPKRQGVFYCDEGQRGM